MDDESLLLDRARSTPLCQPPSPSQAVAPGAATGEEEEERILERPNAAADEPRGQGGGGGGAATLEGEVTNRFAERVGGALES